MADVKGLQEAEEYDDENCSIHDCCEFEAPSPAQELANWSADKRRKMSTTGKSNREDTHCTAPLMKEEQIVHGCWSQGHCNREESIEDTSSYQLAKCVGETACKSCCEANCSCQEIYRSTSIDIREWYPDKWSNSIDANRDSPAFY